MVQLCSNPAGESTSRLDHPRGGFLSEKKRPVTDAKEVGVGNPAEEKTFCHRTNPV
jgi:hypothetical protein